MVLKSNSWSLVRSNSFLDDLPMQQWTIIFEQLCSVLETTLHLSFVYDEKSNTNLCSLLPNDEIFTWLDFVPLQIWKDTFCSAVNKKNQWVTSTLWGLELDALTPNPSRLKRICSFNFLKEYYLIMELFITKSIDDLKCSEIQIQTLLVIDVI